MNTTVSRILLVLFGVFLAFVVMGCSPAPQAQGQLPLARPNDQRWTFVVMSGGPSFYTACVKGDRVYLLDSYLDRSQDWHGTSPKTLAVSPGGCQH